MLHNDIENVINNIFKYLMGNEHCARGYLVKKHDINVQTNGDLSFPNTTKSWHEFLNDSLQNSDLTLLQYINKDVTNLIETSKNWDIPIASAVERKDRIILYIDRLKSIQVCFPTTLYNNNFILDRLNVDITDISFQGSHKNIHSMSYMRLKLLTNVIKNLYLINLYPRKAKVVVLWNNTTKATESRVVFCGPVLDGHSGAKESTISSEEYIRKRQEELMLVAQHKYGYRVTSDCKWKEFISHLGESAIAFELLQAKCSSPVKMYYVSNSGTSKGAAFVLYNCARLETILKTFNAKVADGTYPSLPPMENIDFSLLNDKDEWNLIFNFIMGFPHLLNSCVQFSETVCEFKPHLLCTFLCSMAKSVSQYYRRVRILTEPRQHLLPTLFARIHFIIILNSTLKLCLKILNIKSVSQMYTIFIFFIPNLVF